MPNEEAKNEVYEEKLKGTQHMISSKKLDFFHHPGAKARHNGPLGTARAEPWKRLFFHWE